MESVDYRSIGKDAAALGVTGFTDATPGQGPRDLAALVTASETGAIPQRLHLMAPVGTAPPAARKVTLGPVKVMLDDPDLPPLDDLIAMIQAAHTEGREVAVHCVTLVQATWAVAAFEGVGPTTGSRRDRIEHGAVLSPAVIEHIRALGLTVVTQPGFVAARGDQYLTDVRSGGSGRSVAGPVAARRRRVPSGRERCPLRSGRPVVVDASRRRAPHHQRSRARPRRTAAAIDRAALWTGRSDDPSRSRTIEPGQPADLCVLTGPTPPATVRATIVAGEAIYLAD